MKGGDAFLLDDLCSDVDWCDVGEGKSVGVCGAVTALTQGAGFGVDHVLLTAAPRRRGLGDSERYGGQRHRSPHGGLEYLARKKLFEYRRKKQRIRAMFLWKWPLDY